jgi:beta-glucosidase
VERPVRWLAGFAGAEAAAEERDVEVAIAARAFARWAVERSAWVTEPGAFVLEAGSSSAETDLPLRATVELVTPPRPAGPGTARSAT